MRRITLFLKRGSLNHPAPWLLIFCLVGFGLRLQRLSFQPLWGDEGWSFYLALQPLPDLLALTGLDIHPPLYYLLLKGWLGLTGPGPVEARLLSAASSSLLIPTMYVLGRRLFDRRVGVTGAAITALLPMAIYYGQEVRMYGLVTWLGALAAYFFIGLVRAEAGTGRRPNQGPADWPAYLVTMTAALYSHYYAVLLLIFQGGYLLLERLLRKGGHRPNLAASLSPFLWVGLLYLPWVIYLGPRLSGYVENKRAVEGYLPLSPFRFLADHLVAFSIGHLTTEWGQFSWLALPLLLIAALGFVAGLYPGQGRSYAYLTLYLFTPLLLGYGINLIFPFNPPYFERTLLLAAPAYWLFMATGLVRLYAWRKAAGWAGAAGVGIVLGLSLAGFYTIPRYAEADYRPLLADIAARATPEDTILASYQWQLGFYQAYLAEPRPRLFAVPGWGQGWAGLEGRPRLRQDLTGLLATSPRLWFPAYQAAGHIWEDEAEAELNRLGYPAFLHWYSPQTKLSLTGSSQANLISGPTANFAGRLILLAARVGNDAYEAGRGIIPLELTWQKGQGLDSEYRVNLRLVDSAGRIWASRDSRPQGGHGDFAALAEGEQLPDRHGLLVSAGMPPGRYRLLLSVRRVGDAQPLDLLDAQGQPLGVDLSLNEVTIIDPHPPLDPAALPVQVATAVDFGRAARLLGFSLGSGPFKAGESLPLTLFWQALADQPAPLTLSLQLLDADQQSRLVYEPAPIRPASTWPVGMLLRDPQEVPLPPALPPGPYHLTLALLDADHRPIPLPNGPALTLATIETIDRPHNFERPRPQIEIEASFADQAGLIGVDLPWREVEPGGTLPLTLYWQSLAPFERSWTVFVHLVDGQGHIVSQQDQLPGGGQFPTTGWLPGEYLTDPYTLSLPAGIAQDGAYFLRIGLYDANDFSRLPLVVAGDPISDHLILDNWQISVK